MQPEALLYHDTRSRRPVLVIPFAVGYRGTDYIVEDYYVSSSDQLTDVRGLGGSVVSFPIH